MSHVIFSNIKFLSKINILWLTSFSHSTSKFIFLYLPTTGGGAGGRLYKHIQISHNIVLDISRTMFTRVFYHFFFLNVYRNRNLPAIKIIWRKIVFCFMYFRWDTPSFVFFTCGGSFNCLFLLVTCETPSMIE